MAKPESVIIYIGTYPDAAAAGRQAADNAWRALADPPPGKSTTWRYVPGGRERDSDDATGGGRGGRPG